MTNLTFDTHCLDLQYLEQPHACIEMLLNDGKGLTLGPDSDALLNFCDMPAPAQTDTQAGPDTPAAEDKGKAIAGASAEVPPFFPIPSTASVAHTVMDEDSKYSGAVPLLAVLARAMCTIFAVSTSVKGYHKKLQSLGSTDPGEVLLHRFAFIHISYQAESVLVPENKCNSWLQDIKRGVRKTSIDRLLTAGALSTNAPFARAPSALQTTPRRFQLQACPML